jgi:hypothetical protein
MNNVTLQNYPDLRDLTRVMSEDLQARINGYIEMVSANFRPATVFGSSTGARPAGSAEALAQFTASFKEIAGANPLNVETTLPEVLDFNFAKPSISVFTYQHSITTPTGAKRLTVTAPFRFILTFPDFPFAELRTLVATHGSKEKLHSFVLHYAVLNFVILRNKRLVRLFEDLRFPLRSERFEEFGALPITTISAPAGTVRPPDELITQINRLSGADTAEELADVEAWGKLPDPLEDRFREEATKFSVAVGAAVPARKKG